MGSACGKLHTSHCNATSVRRYHFNRLPAQPAHLSDTLFIYDSKTLHFSSSLNSQDMLLKVILLLLVTCVLFSSVAVDTSDDTTWQMWIISTILIYCHYPVLSDIIIRLLFLLEYQRKSNEELRHFKEICGLRFSEYLQNNCVVCVGTRSTQTSPSVEKSSPPL